MSKKSKGHLLKKRGSPTKKKKNKKQGGKEGTRP